MSWRMIDPEALRCTTVTAETSCTNVLHIVEGKYFNPTAEFFALWTEPQAMAGNSALELIRSIKMSGSRAP